MNSLLVEAGVPPLWVCRQQLLAAYVFLVHSLSGHPNHHLLFSEIVIWFLLLELVFPSSIFVSAKAMYLAGLGPWTQRLSTA